MIHRGLSKGNTSNFKGYWSTHFQDGSTRGKFKTPKCARSSGSQSTNQGITWISEMLETGLFRPLFPARTISSQPTTMATWTPMTTTKTISVSRWQSASRRESGHSYTLDTVCGLERAFARLSIRAAKTVISTKN